MSTLSFWMAAGPLMYMVVGAFHLSTLVGKKAKLFGRTISVLTVFVLLMVVAREFGGPWNNSGSTQTRLTTFWLVGWAWFSWWAALKKFPRLERLGVFEALLRFQVWVRISIRQTRLEKYFSCVPEGELVKAAASLPLDQKLVRQAMNTMLSDSYQAAMEAKPETFPAVFEHLLRYSPHSITKVLKNRTRQGKENRLEKDQVKKLLTHSWPKLRKIGMEFTNNFHWSPQEVQALLRADRREARMAALRMTRKVQEG